LNEDIIAQYSHNNIPDRLMHAEILFEEQKGKFNAGGRTKKKYVM
jgi:hypothetical protein